MLSSTQQFIDALEAKGIKYEINEPTQSGKDVMTVTYSGDRMPTIRCLFFFDEACESVAIRVFDILKVPKERTAASSRSTPSTASSASSSSASTPRTAPSRRRWTPPSGTTTWVRSAGSC